MSPQGSIYQGIGRFSAVTCWTSEVSQVTAVRSALAEWRTEVERDGRVQVLIGIRGEWLDVQPLPLLPREGSARRFPSTQADVFVQLACEEREDLLWALRRADARFAALLRCREEVHGGRIGPGREAFGFLDPRVTPDREQIQREAVITHGPLAGGSWLLYLRLQQDLRRFADLREAERLAVMGQGREGEQLPDAPLDAHVRRMREAGFGENRALIRRGFPFRQEREEGLAFVGLAAHPESHARALDAMLGLGFPGAERLLAYAHPISGGLYVTPSCEWFTPSST